MIIYGGFFVLRADSNRKVVSDTTTTTPRTAMWAIAEDFQRPLRGEGGPGPPAISKPPFGFGTRRLGASAFLETCSSTPFNSYGIWGVGGTATVALVVGAGLRTKQPDRTHSGIPVPPAGFGPH